MIEIAGYRLGKELGAGASGTVYRAVQLGLGREVAVKVLAPGLFDQQETRARFLREAKIQASLSHANLLALFDFGFAGDRPFLVSELAAGGCLRDRLGTGGIRPLAEAIRIAGEVAAGLAHAHRAGIVHRDLKPENVLMTQEGCPKVCDFGLAKSDRPGQTVRTEAGIILGTPGYLAPEAIQGRTAGPEADVYALGVLMYEVFSGRRPFGGETAADVIRAQLQGAVEPARQVCPELPLELDQLLLACLAFDPASRPRSAAHVVERLSAIDFDVAEAGQANRTVVQKMASGRRPASATQVGGGPRLTRASRSGTTAADAARATRTSPGATRVAQGPASGSRRLLGAAAGALMALVLAAGWAMSSRAVTGPAQAPLATVPGAAPRPPLVDFKGARVTRRADGARLWLTAAPGAAFDVAVRPAAGGNERVQRVGGDALRVELPGLEPAKAYVLQLRSGASRHELSFETLGRLTVANSTVLVNNAQGKKMEGVRVGVSGDSVHALFRSETASSDQNIGCISSPDRGESWGELEWLATGGLVHKGPALAFDGDSVLAGWVSGDGSFANRRTVLRLWDAGSRSWAAARSWGGGSTAGVALTGRAEGGFEIVMGVAGPGDRMGWVRWPAGAAQPEPPVVQPSLPPSTKSYTLARSRERLLCFIDARPNVGKEIVVTSTREPASGRWSPPVVLSPAKEEPADVDVAVLRDTVVASFEARGSLSAVASTDGGETFSRRLDPFPDVSIGKSPSTAILNGRFAMCAFDQGLAQTYSDIVCSRSPDGLSWKPFARVAMPPGNSRMVSAVSVADRLLAFVIRDTFGLAVVRLEKNEK
ncbi:MAG: serine/threonine protein kinase [Candidatus Wallbacteria bacterium]|nr:serine/threonine protein kinase [Candidatus Wallbacteria bacterium]